MKNILTTTPILVFHNFKKHFTLDCDASDTGLGSVLSKLDDNNCEHPITYYSNCLSKQERRYFTMKKELLAFVNSVNHFRCYLLGHHFKVRTDHSALQLLHSFKEPAGQVARFLKKLSEYNYDIKHCPEKNHNNADSLSRYPVDTTTNTIGVIGTPQPPDFGYQ